MVFEPPTMTMKNPKSFSLTAFGHMCKTTMFFKANSNVKSTINIDSQDAYYFKTFVLGEKEVLVCDNSSLQFQAYPKHHLWYLVSQV